MMKNLLLNRCPHCSIANPSMTYTWGGKNATPRADGGTPHVWSLYLCSSCGGAVTAKSIFARLSTDADVEIYPDVASVSMSIPKSARSYLNQAYESLGTPDGAVMLASSSVDAMLKEKGYTKGTLNERIEKAADDHLITEEMKLWAHEVRLAGNNTRHADVENPHATTQDAKKVILFADALAYYLYVIPDMVEKGRDVSKTPIV